MADTFQLEVATPERLLVNEQVTLAEIPGANGYLGILAGHAPLMSALNPGVLTYEGGGGGPHVFAIGGGFVEVSDNHVRVLADEAEPANEIQVDKARLQLEEANRKLHDAKETFETEQALRAVQHAQARIDAAERNPGGSH
ncbi:MAG TPA: ATP synthase F1 subunit epsilon [Bryobacteraceae bacterium]|jgi:F-type H+-transporting ATPase subunit epsilon|nr:ATP synthase F1 subunit epsilon [Bryobacteraceae bacterium]